MKYQFFFLTILFLASCNQPQTKSNVNLEYEGNQIDALKSLITSFTAGDWEPIDLTLNLMLKLHTMYGIKMMTNKLVLMKC